MENHHASIARQLFAYMDLKPGERVLQLHCGTGEATRLAAEAVSGGAGMAAGLDFSEDTIAQARKESRHVENALFAVGAGEEVPWRDDFFNLIFCIEVFSGPEAVLRELHRVLVPGGRLLFLASRGEGKPQGRAEGIRSEVGYPELLQAAGFAEIASVPISASMDAAGKSNENGSEDGSTLWMARRP
jgi:ubiquinone/menaquinone biosynthesis C-methylase UbiE